MLFCLACSDSPADSRGVPDFHVCTNTSLDPSSLLGYLLMTFMLRRPVERAPADPDAKLR
eukprot:359258-Chlamydomonas_euryale.AAC.12